MELVKRKKSEDRTKKMRLVYLGEHGKNYATMTKTGKVIITGERTKKYMSWGFNNYVIKKYIKKYIYSFINHGGYLGNLLLINDFDFTLTNWLIATFPQIKSIKAAFIVKDDQDKEWVKEWFDDYFDNLKQLNITFIKEKEYQMPEITKIGKQKNIIIKNWDIKELLTMDFNLIISNPCYGSTGADITDTIRQKVNYNQFVNLLPANDYKRNKTKDLFNYQSEMEPINDGFDDAVVTTHLCLVSKNKVNNMTLDEFEISNYIDRQLDKYFINNHARIHYAIDFEKSNLTMTDIINGTIDKLFLFSERDCSHHHMPYSKTCAHYRWNVLEDVNAEWIKENYVGVRQTKDGVGITKFHGILFNTHEEKLNFANFIFKTDTGFRFISKLFTAMNKDGTDGYRNCFPKVDWSRPWTVEEILKDYGYTEDEIKEVMEDLKNFKGMDD